MQRTERMPCLATSSAIWGRKGARTTHCLEGWPWWKRRKKSCKRGVWMWVWTYSAPGLILHRGIAKAADRIIQEPGMWSKGYNSAVILCVVLPTVHSCPTLVTWDEARKRYLKTISAKNLIALLFLEYPVACLISRQTAGSYLDYTKWGEKNI